MLKFTHHQCFTEGETDRANPPHRVRHHSSEAGGISQQMMDAGQLLDRGFIDWTGACFVITLSWPAEENAWLPLPISSVCWRWVNHLCRDAVSSADLNMV